MSTDNEAVVLRYLDVINNGDYTRLEQLVAEGCTNHDPVNEASDREGIRDIIRKYRAGFSDLRLNCDDLFSSGDRVAYRWSWSGTHDGELEGIAATGKAVGGTGITISRVSDGQIQQMWVNWDALGLMRKLGVVET